ncbi:hypothetical protein [Micromonospora sp. NPDC092111]|uniref:hypothetical protein n=1 Tax=Micromonospora sp. NPDC092111 TaxID=3364289 RepID=UPI003826C69E
MLHRKPDGDLDIAGANQYGQQLFLADMFHRNTPGTPSDAPQHRPGPSDDGSRVWPDGSSSSCCPPRTEP